MIFIDANIMLEILLPNRLKTDQVISKLKEVEQATAISMLTAHLIMHFGRISRIPDDSLRAAIDLHALLPLLPEDYTWAVTQEAGKDFEDALQVSTALRAGCTTFMTLDSSLAKNYAKSHPELTFVTP